MRILAIDPGPTESGWALYKTYDMGQPVCRGGVSPNAEMLHWLQAWNRVNEPAPLLCIEMIASYGMAVGKEVFETCVWIGRFQQSWHAPNEVQLVYRKDVKLHLCGTPRAKDTNVRQALIDKLGAPGTKAKPGPTYGIKSHAWPALAVAVTAHETRA